MLAEQPISMRTLGKTNIKVTPIGLGMMEFSGGGGLIGSAFPVIGQDEKNATVKAALDGGINWFDTAELYGAGLSEASLSKALKAAGKKDDEVVVATKWWPLFERRVTSSTQFRTVSVFWMGTPSAFTWCTSLLVFPRQRRKWKRWRTG